MRIRAEPIRNSLLFNMAAIQYNIYNDSAKETTTPRLITVCRWHLANPQCFRHHEGLVMGVRFLERCVQIVELLHVEMTSSSITWQTKRKDNPESNGNNFRKCVMDGIINLSTCIYM